MRFNFGRKAAGCERRSYVAHTFSMASMAATQKNRFIARDRDAHYAFPSPLTSGGIPATSSGRKRKCLMHTYCSSDWRILEFSSRAYPWQ